jgi:heme o synthase
MRRYIDLTKPRITWLILISAAVGYVFGVPAAHGWPELVRNLDWLRLIHTIIGTGLMASGTAALNQWYEHGSDAKMRRTAGRPIPSGAISPRGALVFGLTISIAGFLELALAVNRISAALGLATLITYLLIYTPLKCRSWWCTTVGAFPGAMPPVIGFAAARGYVSVEAAILFGILFLWQFPHFYSIAWMYREDYARAGIQMLPVTEPDGASTARQMMLYAAALLLFSAAPAAFGMAGRLYVAAAVLLGAWLLHATIRAARTGTVPCARGVLIASVMHLPLLYLFLVLDRAW